MVMKTVLFIKQSVISRLGYFDRQQPNDNWEETFVVHRIGKRLLYHQSQNSDMTCFAQPNMSEILWTIIRQTKQDEFLEHCKLQMV